MKSKILISILMVSPVIYADIEFEQLKQRVTELEVEVAQWRPVLKALEEKQTPKKTQTTTRRSVASKISLEQFVANAPNVQKTTLEDLVKAGVDKTQITPENLHKYGIDVGHVSRGALAIVGINPDKWNVAQAFSSAVKQGSEYALEGSPVTLQNKPDQQIPTTIKN